MPVTITNTNRFPILINDATETQSGAMSAADKTKLDGFPNNPFGAFPYTVSQPADGSDFFVSLPAGLVQSTVNYGVSMTIASVTISTEYTIPFVSQTKTAFRVVTDGTLSNGTPLIFTVTPF